MYYIYIKKVELKGVIKLNRAWKHVSGDCGVGGSNAHPVPTVINLVTQAYNDILIVPLDLLINPFYLFKSVSVKYCLGLIIAPCYVIV